MTKRKKDLEKKNNNPLAENVHIKGAGTVQNEAITNTLKGNYMPYAMSVILSRAIPEIDGLKPSHRKLLYTMYNMGLLQGGTIKSANIVGRTMQLNPHGDAAIYETMVRLSRGNETLLYPFVESKGNFGKAYSKNMAYAASRYTEAKLAPICHELFDDIKLDTVDFVPNYDNTMTEPTLLPVTFPSILCNVTTGIAVGMASSIASFNLSEICETTIALMKNSEHVISDTLIAPDFVGGGFILYDKQELDKIYETGRGSVKVRAKYSYDKKYNCIDIIQIPPTTTSEAIIDKIVELVKSNKIKEISDVRDETDLSGLRITIDLKRGVDADAFMNKLYKMTPLQDTFSCNFNVLIKGRPVVLGVRSILNEWVDFRLECIRRRITFNLDKKRRQLHLLKGLSKILLDIDKAIKIVRETESETEVVPNLMIGFGIDETQAEYVAEIKLRHLNREYILKRIKDIEQLENDIEELEDILSSKNKMKKIIIKELQEISAKYDTGRKSVVLYDYEEAVVTVENEIQDYPVTLFLTEQGYLKKIKTANLRMSGEQKVKEGDKIISEIECSNKDELLFFTNQHQVYKSKADDFIDTKASVLGEYVPGKLEMADGEQVVYMALVSEYSGYMIFVFENGKLAKVDVSAYQTKTNRKKLINAYSDKSPLAQAIYIKEDTEIVICSSSGRMLLVNTASILPKTTKDTQGVAVMKLKKTHKVISLHLYKEGEFEKAWRFRAKNLPATGAMLSEADIAEQITF
ncbi:MAG: DNA topoisomerase (ATP-hydrolyzing) subunit A [Acetobacter sp.]|nr:DNA topoisomerase (ATP-hydrolyzing) subunit A [Bacteroides sp.]MCM1341420.1 DNA topoisomerase (ATP-hydrolyzing) subunit A [Acetobacter sp.]MCM1433374.1 DNA topoisomerase (ATP-hydrolyzing) subunit A [Clostridiales bacterium]